LNIGLALLGLIFSMMLIGVPIYLALGAAGTAGLFMLKGNPLIVIPQSIFTGAGFFPLLAIPFFILAGELMNRGGITERLVNFARLLIGKAPASLANSSILACMFFGGVTGSAQADTSAIGGLLIPAMTKEGYKPAWSAALIASAATCGPIIPPSIMMVVYCVTVGESIGAMFMGGFIPGILIAVGLIIAVLIMNVKQKFPRRYEKIAFKDALRITIEGLLPLIMPLIIIGGILGGIFTPTEAGAIAVFYSLIIGFFVLKTLTLGDLVPMLKHTAFLTSNVIMIICCAKILGWVFAAVQVQVFIGEFFISVSNSPAVYLLLVNLLLLFVGMFMDGTAAIIILAPILTPIALSLGINGVHFGLIMVLNLVIGAGTPPLGVCVFIASGIAQVPIDKTFRAIMPFLAAEIIVLFAVTYFPDLVLIIPRMFGYG
jgi:tripartite ATP-independent transporter DctM subunit